MNKPFNPTPGLHRIDAEIYHAGPGVSRSQLLDVGMSPHHYFMRHRDPNRPPPAPSTAAQVHGTVAHTAILEPEEFHRRHPVGPDVNRNTKEWKLFAESHAGKVCLKPDEAEAALAQAASVRSIPDVAALLSRGESEVSAYGVDPVTGLLCRARPDYTHRTGPGRVILVDVKTFNDASSREFSRQVARQDYHMQDAFYSDVYTWATGDEVVGFVFIAVEDRYPYAAAAYMLDDDARIRGRIKYRALLDRLAACEAAGDWPGYSGTIEPLSIPDWA